ncbi:hypothetical protein [Mycobacterium sp. OTB74]|uniref:hypothetical protein n=1 Tax=Mycobacterium sp. OTB74 TaxID=1853452 RepID=UPI002475553D|nr:hypothetical protein [Mycobacterium sp. OTB74]MDH6243010.1 hypothetical protein [Mycobacterium sp. OTB74]
MPRNADGSSIRRRQPGVAETHHLDGVYAKLTALEELVDGNQDPRINHLDADDPEREFWPVERSRLLPLLRAGEPVLVNRTHAAIVGGWPDSSAAGSMRRTALDRIGFFCGPRLSVRNVGLEVTGWIVDSTDTVTAHYSEPPGQQRYWELDRVEVTGAGMPMAQYLAGGRNGRKVKIC